MIFKIDFSGRVPPPAPGNASVCVWGGFPAPVNVFLEVALVPAPANRHFSCEKQGQLRRPPLQTVSAVVSISKVIMGSILVSMALCRLVGAYLYAMESV